MDTGVGVRAGDPPPPHAQGPAVVDGKQQQQQPKQVPGGTTNGAALPTVTSQMEKPKGKQQNGRDHDDNDDVVMTSSPPANGKEDTVKMDQSAKKPLQTTEMIKQEVRDGKKEDVVDGRGGGMKEERVEKGRHTLDIDKSMCREDEVKSPVSIVIDREVGENNLDAEMDYRTVMGGDRREEEEEEGGGGSGRVDARTAVDGTEEGHDSGVDESTQAKENGQSRSSSKASRSSPKKRQPRSSDPSPMKPRTPLSAASSERKGEDGAQKGVPMNKVEVGKTASPNLKSVKSKIGSMDNATHRPGGGKIKIESKKIDFSKASSKIAAKNVQYSPGGGDKKIESQKLAWSAKSKIGSLDNKDHKPGGGDKKIENQKLKIAAASKVGSRDNIKHRPGGGDVQRSARSEGRIEQKKLDFKDKAASRVGSLNNVTHKAGGGDKKIFDDKDYLRQAQASPCKTPTSEANLSRTGSPSPAITSPATQEDQILEDHLATQEVTPSEK